MNRRLEGIESFYSVSAAQLKVIDEELNVKGASEDMLGRLMLDRFQTAAGELGLKAMVCEENSGKVPVVQELDMYKMAHLESVNELIGQLEDSFDSRMIFIKDLKAAIDLIVKPEEASVKLKIQGELSREQQALFKDKLQVTKLKNDSDKAAIMQHQLDCDALVKVNTAMKVLKNHVIQLLKRMPKLMATCRKVDSNGADPLEATDMHCVFRNLTNRFRKHGDKVQILTFIMAGMKEEQLKNGYGAMKSVFLDSKGWGWWKSNLAI